MGWHDVVIVGGGNAGISLAARLRRLGCRDVAVVAPGPDHLYRPLLNYVAAGQAAMRRLTRSMGSVVPEGCTWLDQRAVAVHAAQRQIELAGGERVGYGDLVVATGLEEDLEAVPGLAEAIDAGWSGTAHLAPTATSSWQAVQRLRSGRVVFTLPPEPSPCGGTALKPLFLACDHWRRQGVLGALDVHLVTPYSSVLDLPFVEQRLRQSVARFGITVHHGARVAALDHARRTVTLRRDEGGQETVTDVAHAFVVPPYRAPGWLRPLAAEHDAGLVDVDPETLAHRTLPRIWSLGDVADVRTRPSGGALRRQVEVLAANIRAARLGEPLHRYDGYTIIPVTVDRRRLLLAEFDRAGRQQQSTSLLDVTVPRRALWVFDRYLEPVIYFRLLLRGRLVP